ncbi:MAG: formate--tetrahydrofolate ligase [Pseudoclavibacter sp.]
MTAKTDIEIAQETPALPIAEVADRAGLAAEALEPYGRDKAKIDIASLADRPRRGRLILVTAISPTPAGEGKTTTAVGLADALTRLGARTVLCQREPSLGPVFGLKGGATGGGRAQVIPMEDINLHFTGDIHAVGAANNLLAALLDNHIERGNALGIDPRRIRWRRVVDMNDRQLRRIVDGLGGPADGMPREDGFSITAASEVMAVLCLATGLADLKQRLGRMVVGYTFGYRPVTAHDLHAEGAMATLLRDAIKPNLVQTLEHTPALVHGGPFANIAHGCNSVAATSTALRLADYAVTEAGFGADLGAEKFCDIVCRGAGLAPAAAVLVATVRGLKYHGGKPLDELEREDEAALERGLPHLRRHLDNLQQVFGLPVVVAVNAFPTDAPAELDLLERRCRDAGVDAVRSEVWARGGAGGVELARRVIALADRPSRFSCAYELDAPLADKIRAVATRVYRADGVVFSAAARAQLDRLTELGFGGLPVCMAKTPYSFTDDRRALGAPTGFDITVRAVRVAAGAGFVIALTGDILTMPGLPRHPAAEGIDVDANGRITGLF